MSLTAQRLFELARDVEVRIAVLYEDMAAHFPPGSEEVKFFSHLGSQEHMHAAWVDEMMGAINPAFCFEALEEDEFRVVLDSLDDIHDEVMEEDIALPDALEILLHLENSTAEDFYLHFPEEIPGLERRLVERMIQSCHDHARSVAEFRKECIARGKAGVHTPKK